MLIRSGTRPRRRRSLNAPNVADKHLDGHTKRLVGGSRPCISSGQKAPCSRAAKATSPSYVAPPAIPRRANSRWADRDARAPSCSGAAKFASINATASAASTRASPANRVRTEYVSAKACPQRPRVRLSAHAATAAWCPCEAISSGTAILVPTAVTGTFVNVARSRSERTSSRR